ncbi:MAG: hypothetical protein R3F19_08760 [Verrucomicrobiales bacterium]
MEDLPPTESSIIAAGTPAFAPPGAMFESLVNHFSQGARADELEPAILTELREEMAAGEHFSRDMSHLWQMLETVLAKSGRATCTGADDSFRLLNLACGHCEEAAVLSAFFGRMGKPVRQFAMDLRDREIDKARRRYAATEALFQKAGVPKIRAKENTIEFVADDATRLVGYGQIPSAFDVVFMRHQNLWNGLSTWRRIYSFALERIATDGGTLIITSYFDKEHLQALELLRSLGGTILSSERNPRSRELDYPGKSVDRHVAAIATVPPA